MLAWCRLSATLCIPLQPLIVAENAELCPFDGVAWLHGGSKTGWLVGQVTCPLYQHMNDENLMAQLQTPFSQLTKTIYSHYNVY